MNQGTSSLSVVDSCLREKSPGPNCITLAVARVTKLKESRFCRNKDCNRFLQLNFSSQIFVIFRKIEEKKTLKKRSKKTLKISKKRLLTRKRVWKSLYFINHFIITVPSTNCFCKELFSYFLWFHSPSARFWTLTEPSKCSEQ